MPQDNDFNLICPTCGREIKNYAQHPDHPDRTLAYCVCNLVGPVLEFTTATPPQEFVKQGVTYDTSQ